MIEVAGLALSIGDRVLFSGLDLKLRLGTITAVLGPSGVGKTTLLGAIAGHVSPSHGTITLPAGTKVAWAQQNSPMLVRRSVIDNVALGAECVGAPEREATEEAVDALRVVGLSEIGGVRAGKLSGGERQRVSVARALVSGSSLILADEPTASLDPESKERVVDALRGAASRNRCVVVATHDPEVALVAGEMVNLSNYVGDRAGR